MGLLPFLPTPTALIPLESVCKVGLSIFVELGLDAIETSPTLENC